MKKMVKKNQIIITALAIMIAVAGYLSFTSKEVSIIDENGNPVEVMADYSDDAQETLQTDANTELSAETGATEDLALLEGAEGNSDDAEVSAPVNDAIGEAVLTNADTIHVTTDAIVNAKLNREQTRSRAQELLLIVGAKHMYEKQKVTLPNMDSEGTSTTEVYRNIMEELYRKGTFKGSEKVISPETEQLIIREYEGGDED